jgi:tRNA(fMet)-specific endonuclease VapC
VKAELLYGLECSQRKLENEHLLKRLFAQFDCFPFDDRAAEHYAKIRAILRTAGTPIGANDLLIASIARCRALTVVTRNVGEFQRVPGLAVATW